MSYTVKKVTDWILTSSANPAEVSLTIRGILMGAIPIIMTFVGLTHLSVSSDMLTSLTNAFVIFVQAALAIVSATMIFVGAARKVWYGLFPKTVAQ